MNEDKSRVLLWAGAACLTMGWIAEITAAAFGPVPAWPNWLMLVAVTGLVASNLLRLNPAKGVPRGCNGAPDGCSGDRHARRAPMISLAGPKL